MILGCHMSIAGGVHLAVERASALKLDCMAMFVRNQRQWKAPALTDEQASLFKTTRRRLGIGPVVAHGSYLINLAGDEPVRSRSIAAMADELERCRRLGVEFYVFHPGACADASEGMARITAALDELLAGRRLGPRVLLETTAGQGSAIGTTFEQLAGIIALCRRRSRLGVCLDTCHVFAAGYDLSSAKGYRDMWRQFDKALGMKSLGAIHLNDSLKAASSHVDRHAHISRGMIGLDAFARLANDKALADVPMILETPKGLDTDGRDLDEVNIQTMRSLVR